MPADYVAPMLHRFSAKRYRQLDVDGLELGRLNLLVGPNNAGKSTLVKAIRFAEDLLARPHQGSEFHEVLNVEGRGDMLDRASAVPGDIELAWTFSPVPGDAPTTYELGFKVGKTEDFPSGFYLAKERLEDAGRAGGAGASALSFEAHSPVPGQGSITLAKRAGEPLTFSFSAYPHDTVLAQRITPGTDAMRFYTEVSPALERVTRELKSYFGGFHEYASAAIDPARVTLGVPRDISVTHLDRDGVHFANVLRYIDQHEGLDEYTRVLAQVLPDLRRVKPIDVSDEHVAVRLDIGVGRRFKMYEMSHGTIKAMLLALLVSTPVRMSLLALDEP